mmetsp:Transcript_9843/g.26712  ORF Transcript_9843/g.26712 Transcript_9843/m.26712 type:complete len:300 (-) Transcript_9843:4776-5675(-)
MSRCTASSSNRPKYPSRPKSANRCARLRGGSSRLLPLEAWASRAAPPPKPSPKLWVCAPAAPGARLGLGLLLVDTTQVRGFSSSGGAVLMRMGGGFLVGGLYAAGDWDCASATCALEEEGSWAGQWLLASVTQGGGLPWSRLGCLVVSPKRSCAICDRLTLGLRFGVLKLPPLCSSSCSCSMSCRACLRCVLASSRALAASRPACNRRSCRASSCDWSASRSSRFAAPSAAFGVTGMGLLLLPLMLWMPKCVAPCDTSAPSRRLPRVLMRVGGPDFCILRVPFCGGPTGLTSSGPSSSC